VLEDFESVVIIELETVLGTEDTVTEDWLVVVSLVVEVEDIPVTELEVVDCVLVVELPMVVEVVGKSVRDEVSVGDVVCVDEVSLPELFCLFPNSAMFCAASPSCG